MEETNGHGGRREGAGRPVGATAKKPRVIVNFTPEQVDKVRGFAEKRGLSVPEFLRFTALSYCEK